MMDPQTLASGRYLLVERLGEGGMATVYRAFDQRLQVWRAIKVLLPQYARNKKLMRRFEAEAQTMALLEHPHIVRVYDVDEDEGVAYIVMELVEGGSLVDWLEEHGAMPARLAVDVMVEVCQAIQYAHDRGVIHRDIKPHNVMVDRNGTCRVTDFGIARAGDAEKSLTKTGAVMGTWGYMAPEQRSDAKHVDARADVYALAATLYSLVTNETPMDLFAADRDPTMLERVHGILVDPIRQGTEYDRDKRFGSAQELAAALLALRESTPPIPETTPPLVVHTPADATPPPPRVPDPSEESPRPGTQATQATLLPEDGMGPALPGLGEPREPSDPGGAVMPRRATVHEMPVAAAPASGPPLGRLVAAGLAVLALAVALGVGAWMSSTTSDPGVEPIPAPTPTTLAGPADDEDAPAAADEEAGEDPVATDEAPSASGSSPAAAPAPPEAPASAPEPEPTPPRPAPSEATPEPAPEPEEAAAPDPAPEPEPVAQAQCFKLADVPGSVEAGGSVPFKVKTCLDAPVTLHYRVADGGTWYTKKMAKRFGFHVALVPVDEAFADGLEWYVSSEGVSHGSSRVPKRVAVAVP